MADTIQVITAATALAAVIIGPFVSIWIARRQIRASVVSANRQAWINSLREAIAAYLAKEAMARILNRQASADSSSISRIEEIIRLQWHIDLLLNPQEEEHSHLVTLLETLTNSVNRDDSSSKVIDANIDGHRQQVIDISKRILKLEWERVKRGD